MGSSQNPGSFNGPFVSLCTRLSKRDTKRCGGKEKRTRQEQETKKALREAHTWTRSPSAKASSTAATPNSSSQSRLCDTISRATTQLRPRTRKIEWSLGTRSLEHGVNVHCSCTNSWHTLMDCEDSDTPQFYMLH